MDNVILVFWQTCQNDIKPVQLVCCCPPPRNGGDAERRGCKDHWTDLFRLLIVVQVVFNNSFTSLVEWWRCKWRCKFGG